MRGPGVPFEAGHYVVSITWGGVLTGRVDACSAGGARVHATRNLVAAGHQGAARPFRFDFVLSTDVQDLEFLIQANEGDEGWISGIDVQPLRPSQGRGA